MAKILLVEDDKSLREIYGVRLMAEGYDIVSAGDGEEALALAIKERPDLIISDVMMPKISGFDMLDILRSTTETKDVKVIMMTALSSEDQRARGESLGADRYLVKSQVGIEDVVRTVREVIGDILQQASAAQPAPVEAEPAVITPITIPEPVQFAEPAPMPVASAPVPIDTPAVAQPLEPEPQPMPAPAPVVFPAAPSPVEPVAQSTPMQPASAPLNPVAPAPQPTAQPIPQPAPAPTPDPVQPVAPVEPSFTPLEVPTQPVITQPAPTPLPVDPVQQVTPQPVVPAPAVAEPVVTPAAVPPVAPAPLPQANITPQPATPAPATPLPDSNLPEPTAPFSSPAPASLAERVIEPLVSQDPQNSDGQDVAAQMAQALGQTDGQTADPALTPAPQVAPADPFSTPIPPPPVSVDPSQPLPPAPLQ